jgi:hypothetical protein
MSLSIFRHHLAAGPWFRLCGVWIVVLCGGALLSGGVVSNLNDAGPGSLRQVIAEASPDATITFNPALSDQTILLSSGPLVIAKDLSIDASALPDGLIIDANGTSAVIAISADVSAVLDSLTLTGGEAFSGGGVQNSGTLLLQNSTITGNSGNLGGGILNSGDLTLQNSTVSMNSATYGAGVINSGTLTVRNSTIAGNTASFYGGIDSASGTLHLFNSIVSANGGDDLIGPITPESANNLIGAPPRLAPLGRYGGPTSTMPPLPGSPAIEGGSLDAETPATDQIGKPRPSGPLPDIGAVEALPLAALGLPSTDGDRIPDLLEGPEKAYPHLSPAANDSTVDTDGDGSPDAEELANMTDLFDGTDYFRVLAYKIAEGWSPLSDPSTDPAVTITLSTFPGLTYSFEAGGTLLEGDYLKIPSATFTADAFEATLDLILPPGSEFIRAKRED